MMTIQKKWLSVCVTIGMGVFFVAQTRAEHAQIELVVRGKEAQKVAIADQEPPLGGVNPRPLLKVKANEPLVMQFILTNIYPHGVVKAVKVRYFVVKVKQTKQKQVPDLKAGVVTMGTIVMNFKPKCKVGARLRFRVSEPGVYLVRSDTVHTKSDHEHFSSIDLVVE